MLGKWLGAQKCKTIENEQDWEEAAQERVGVYSCKLAFD